jgi:hypothetical protein
MVSSLLQSIAATALTLSAFTGPGPSAAAAHAECRVRGPLPDSVCTPGTTLAGATARDVCTPGWAGRHRNVSSATKRRVYAAYGIAHHGRGEYEVDHLVSLELGGSNLETNLFPEAAEPRPGFHEKDRLENRLHDLVCAGTVSLAAAQTMISGDWIRAYRRYVSG